MRARLILPMLVVAGLMVVPALAAADTAIEVPSSDTLAIVDDGTSAVDVSLEKSGTNYLFQSPVPLAENAAACSVTDSTPPGYEVTCADPGGAFTDLIGSFLGNDVQDHYLFVNSVSVDLDMDIALADGDDVVYAGGGTNAVDARGGNDYLYNGEGGGSDSLEGGEGDDLISVQGNGTDIGGSCGPGADVWARDPSEDPAAPLDCERDLPTFASYNASLLGTATAGGVYTATNSLLTLLSGSPPDQLLLRWYVCDAPTSPGPAESYFDDYPGCVRTGTGSTQSIAVPVAPGKFLGAEGSPYVFGGPNGSEDTGFITLATIPIVAPPSAPVLPSNAFNFGKVKVDKKKGTATIEVKTPGAGVASIAKSKTLAASKKTAAGAATVKLTVKTTGKSLKKLKKKKKLKVSVPITFTPTGGQPKTTTKSVTLKRK